MRSSSPSDASLANRKDSTCTVEVSLSSELRATMKQMEDALQSYPMIVRSHRAFLVNLSQVEQISSNSRTMQLVMRHNNDIIPVSRSNVSKLKEMIEQR